MESLQDLQLRISYRTGRDDLVDDFFVPCLKSSILYRRAAGYFSSAGLALAARGVASIASTGGKMQLVVSPHLQPEDVEALLRATENTADVLRAITARSLDDIEDALVKDRLNALAWLAASRALEIKLALRLDRNGNFARGLFHEKAGIFTDSANNHVAFSGSSNETAGGLLENFESIKVFCSWKDAEGRVEEEIDNFDALWNDTTPGLKIMGFSEAGRELLERYRDPDNPPPGIPQGKVSDERKVRFAPPQGFELRPYQADAIRAWSSAGGQGILAMATGAGKTLTALTLASKVAERNTPMALIIVCPFINLCRQWIREISAFGIQAVAAFEGKQRWQTQFEEGYQSMAVGMSSVHAVVTTNATFQSKAFQSRLQPRVASGSIYHLLIADEVHNLGAKRIQDLLPEGISMRLGLSATPERHHDPEGTATVLNYFGGIVYEYSLAQAIADGRLCNYRYYPIPVRLTDEETETYMEISEKLARFFSNGEDDSELQQAAMFLLIKRARLLASAQNKLTALQDVLNAIPETTSKGHFLLR